MASDSDIDTIRDRIDIVQLISAHTRLKKSGANFSGLCPFHKEKTPSFTVNPERKFWHCFGCGEGGDVFTFVMKTDNVDFSEALQILARMAGVQLQPFRPEQAGRAKERETILKINALAARYFAKVLAHEKVGAPFRAYLDKRGMPAELVAEYKIGASRDAWDGIIRAFEKREISPDALVSAGLAVRKESRVYDRFRERLIFTLTNTVGDIVGFAGRAMGDAMPKYLNTPETALFDKGRLIYNLDHARKHVENGTIILTEGYMDVLALVKAGILNAVASMGTSLTNNQVEMLRRYCSGVYLSYDSDIAGDAAAMRGIELLIGSGLDIRVVSLPQGQDPDDVIRTGGKEAYMDCLNNAKGYFQYFLEKSTKKRGTQDAAALRDIILEITPLIIKSPNELLQDDQVRYMSDTLGIDERRVRSVMTQASPRPRNAGTPPPEIVASTLLGSVLVEKKVIEYLFSDAESAATILERLDASYFKENRYRTLFKYCKQYREKKENFRPDEFLNDTHPQEVVTVLSGIKLTKPAPDDEGHSQGVKDLLDKLVTDVKKRRITELKNQIVRAEREGNRELMTKLMIEMNNIKKDIT